MTIAYSNIPDALPLDLSTLKLTDEQFYQLCIANPEQPLELTAAGVLIVMPPVAGESGSPPPMVISNAYLNNWSEAEII